MFWSKLCKLNWNCAWNLAFPVLTYCMEYVWKSSLWIGIFQEYYWPTIYRAGAAVVSTITSNSIFSTLWSTVDYLSPNERCFNLVRFQVQITANPGIRYPVPVKTLLRDTFFSSFTHLFLHVFVFFSLLDETHINQIICHVYYTGFQVSWLVSKFCFDLQ